jgi:hypothetical protein
MILIPFDMTAMCKAKAHATKFLKFKTENVTFELKMFS